MLVTHMLAKGEINGMFWLFGLPLFIGVGALVGYHKFGTAGEYTMYAVGAADLIIGFLTFTRDGRRDAALVRKSEKASEEQRIYRNSEQGKIDKKNKLNEEARKRYLYDQLLYTRRYDQVAERYKDAVENMPPPDYFDGSGDRWDNDHWFCGLPFITKDNFVLVLQHDRILKLETRIPQKHKNLIIADVPLTDPEQPFDANILSDKLGEPLTRVYRTGTEDTPFKVLAENETRKYEKWIFEIEHHNLQTCQRLDNEYDFRIVGRPLDKPYLPDHKQVKQAVLLTAEPTSVREPSNGTFTRYILRVYPGFRVDIERSDDGTPIIIDTGKVDRASMDYARENLVNKNSVSKL